jgi:hypothetical protein
LLPGGELLSAKAAVQQNNEIEAVAARSCGIFLLIARLTLMTRGINRILHLFRSVYRVKLDDAGTERGAWRLKQEQ